MDKPTDISVFEDKYLLDTSVLSTEMCPESQQGMFETYGQDLEHVLKIANGDKPNRVWTAVDCDEGFCLINGYHLVNRVYYMVTTEEGGEFEDYLIDDYEREEFE
jgi:hypothetical protein